MFSLSRTTVYFGFAGTIFILSSLALPWLDSTNGWQLVYSLSTWTPYNSPPYYLGMAFNPLPYCFGVALIVLSTCIVLLSGLGSLRWDFLWLGKLYRWLGAFNALVIIGLFILLLISTSFPLSASFLHPFLFLGLLAETAGFWLTLLGSLLIVAGGFIMT